MLGVALMQFALAATVAALIAPAASPAPFDTAEEIANGNFGFKSIPITRQETPNQTIRRRDSDVPLYNVSSVSYLIELAFGTPAQKIKVAIDTGSDELWVNPNCSTAGTEVLVQECNRNGRYSYGDSSTSSLTDVRKYIPYGKGDATIRYVVDNITLSDSTLQVSQQVFGIALDSNELNEGILGLGYGELGNLQYSHLVDSLFNQNQTNTRAFSIALGSKGHGNSGTLIFGGVDTKKFYGDLVSRPILGPQMDEEIRRYWVTLDTVSYNTGSGSKKYNSEPIPVVLDSGTTLSYLPDKVVTAMAFDLGGQFLSSGDFWQVPCEATQTSNTMDFQFGDATIRVPMYEFIWNAGGDVCVLGAIGVASNGVALLGDSMMRAGYFVFDQDNSAIHMAQYATCGENEQAIPAGGTATSFSGECSEADIDLGPNGATSARASPQLACVVITCVVAFFYLL